MTDVNTKEIEARIEELEDLRPLKDDEEAELLELRNRLAELTEK